MTFLETLEALRAPIRLHRRIDLIGRESIVPKKNGLYAWYFKQIPKQVPTNGCITFEGFTLLYIGIAPKDAQSSQTLRNRLNTHMNRNASSSTVRLSLGCLLSDPLGIQLRRVRDSGRMTFADGEETLSKWLEQNAMVTWVYHSKPWEAEKELIQNISLPLNLDHNTKHPFYLKLKDIRKEAKRIARDLPIYT